MAGLYRQTWGLILFLALTVAGCSNEQTASTDQVELADSVPRPDTELSGARIYLYDKSRITAEIMAEKIVKFEAIDSMMAYTLDIDVYDSAGQVSTQVVGDSGIIRESSGKFYVYGNVVVIAENKSKLETDYLYWDTKTDQIKTDAFVKITKDDDIITGWGMEADQRLNRIKILKEVSGTITDPKEISEP
ncbi:MAG: LPS export ABC transporter periplasmic protein LptC [Candidatus Zixiibacteriota bacterium]